MRKKKPSSFLDLVFSAPTLIPLLLGVGGGAALWWLAEKQRPLATFLMAAGGLGSLGSLLTMMLFNGPALDPALRDRRRTLQVVLEELADARSSPSPETQSSATAAPVEQA
jgi:hypothetical protein